MYSVLMSVYFKDNSLFLKEALESLRNQTVTPTEIILVKDGPLTPELEVVISEFEVILDNLKIISNTVNSGLSVALNKGLKYVTTDYIARMDSDDICFFDRFEKQLNFMNNNHEVDCVGTWAIEINESGDEFFKKRMPLTHKECYEFFRKRDCLIHPSVMFRNTYFEKAGLYPEDTYFGEDTMMWVQGFKNGCKFANIPEYLIYFRMDKNFFNRRRGLKHAKSILNLRIKATQILGYGFFGYVYAFLYFFAKLLPSNLLNVIYKKAR